MRKEKSEAAKVDRRGFLKQAGLVIGTAGAAATVGGANASAESEQTPSQAAGYRETEHVRTYYKLARL
jgi:nitrous oxide reductase